MVTCQLLCSHDPIEIPNHLGSTFSFRFDMSHFFTFQLPTELLNFPTTTMLSSSRTTFNTAPLSRYSRATWCLPRDRPDQKLEVNEDTNLSVPNNIVRPSSFGQERCALGNVTNRSTSTRRRSPAIQETGPENVVTGIGYP